MILLVKLDKGLYLIQYKGEVKSVKDHLWKLRKSRHNVKTLRYIICKATRLNASQIRFIGNRREHGNWYTEWMEI